MIPSFVRDQRKGVVSNGARTLITGLTFFLLAFVVYLPSADFGFICYDDVRILRDHPELYSGPTLRQAITAIFTLLPREEPLLLRDLTWALDASLFGFPNPRGFHLVNVAVHAGVIGLGFVFLLRVTRRYALAVIASLCYLALAVHVEPVAWIMGRKDLLAALFGFLALIAHSRALDAGASRARWAWYGASLLAVTLALFSKISAITFPGVLFLLALCQPAMRGDEPPGSRFPWHRIPRALAGVLPHLIVSLSVFHWYKGVLSEFGLLNRGYTATPWQHVANVLVLNPLSWLRDLQLLLCPGDLPFFHPRPGSVTTFQFHHVAAAAMVWLAIIALTVVLLMKRRDYAFYFLAFFVLMVPYMNLQYFGIWVTSRYLYFSGFFVIVLLAAVATDAWQTRSRPLAWGMAAALVVIVAANGWSLTRSLPAWRDAETLWTHELLHPDAPADAFYNLASFYYTSALRATDPTERARLLQNTTDVVARARPRFHAPFVALQNLMLLEALVTVVRGAPPEQQRAALLAAERIGPDNADILWQLVLFHHQQALAISDVAQRQALARQALAYYKRYRVVVYRNADFAKRDRGIRAEFLSNFPFLAPELGELP